MPGYEFVSWYMLLAPAKTPRPVLEKRELVVRTGPGHGLDPTLVADALDLPLAGVVEEDPSVRGALERGDPPGRSGRSALAHLCVRLLREQPEAAA